MKVTFSIPITSAFRFLTHLLFPEPKESPIVPVEVHSANISKSGIAAKIIVGRIMHGMGKTHIAYDVGKKHFLILIRVMGNSGEFNGDQLSHKCPWDSALEHMKQFKARSLAEPLIQRAKGMLRYIHILLYSYLQFIISALNAVALDLERRKKLVLRLHRNGVADELIKLPCLALSRSTLSKFEEVIFHSRSQSNDGEENGSKKLQKRHLD